MRNRIGITTAFACLCLLAMGATVYGQTYTPITNGGQLTSKTTRAISFYGGNVNSVASLQQIPRRRASPPMIVSPSAVKPFAREAQRATVSPYLNLFRTDEQESAPNYYSLVRPELRQQQFVQRQNAVNQRVRSQIHLTAARQGVSLGRTYGLPTTGHTTRYMNRGGYYSVRR